MKVGFTGTRSGMTKAQGEEFARRVAVPAVTEFHHGACIGADATAAVWVANMHTKVKVVAHPGKPANGQANEFLSEAALDVSHEVLPEKTHFARNRDIVAACDVLVATPWQDKRPPKGTGGGTWYTIEQAEKADKLLFIIWPDGRLEALNGIEFETIDS